jgi:Rab GDP dissociation inhibitor
VLGTGLKECILAGILSHQGKKVLQLDRNNYYGGACASLPLDDLFKKFRGETPADAFDRLGRNRDYNVDLIPKLLLADGDLVEILVWTNVTRYLEFFPVDGSFAVKGGAPGKVPGNATEAVQTSLVGFFQKRWLRGLLKYCASYDAADKSTHKGYDLTTMTMRELYKKYGCDDNTAEFVGHCMALHTSDAYLDQPAIKTVEAIKIYAYSLAKFDAGSPYLYPLYGLGGLPEGFSRMCAISGGTFMLNRDISKIVMGDDGKVAGVLSVNEDGVTEAAATDCVIGDPSYFADDKCKKLGRVIRTICLLKSPIPKLGCESAQLIIPQGQCKPARNSDIYVSMLSKKLECTPRGVYAATISTTVETDNPSQELEPAIQVCGGPANIHERFEEVSDYMEPLQDGTSDRIFISKSYDATSHFQTVVADIRDLYLRITGEELKVPSPGEAAGASGATASS